MQQCDGDFINCLANCAKLNLHRSFSCSCYQLNNLLICRQVPVHIPVLMTLAYFYEQTVQKRKNFPKSSLFFSPSSVKKKKKNSKQWKINTVADWLVFEALECMPFKNYFEQYPKQNVSEHRQ